jgi:hypothetical protein
MAMRDARIKCTGALGMLAAHEGCTAPADHALAMLALFEDFSIGTVRDHEQDLSLWCFNTALLFCSQIAGDAGGVPLLYASLAPRARDSIFAALRKWIDSSRVQALGGPFGGYGHA